MASATIDHPRAPEASAGRALSEMERLQSRIRVGAWLPLLYLAAAGLLWIAAGDVGDWTCAVLVLASSYPAVHLWLTRRVLGLPTLPLLAVAYVVFYALPFVSGNPIVAQYEFGEKVLAAATIAFVLALSSIVWAALSRPGPPRERRIRMVVPGFGVPLFVGCLVAGSLFQVNSFLWIVEIPYEIYGVLRAVLHNVGLVAVFALSYLLGARHVSGRVAIALLALVPVFASASIMSLYLIGAMEIVFLALLGYFLGSGRVPWKTSAALLLVFAVLHAGKANMREQYWSPETGLTPPRNPVAAIEEWVGFGLQNLFSPADAEEDGASLLERASLMHMLLRTQTEAPERVPFLYGESYTGIPMLMVPRFVWPERPTTQEMLIRLNEHYGLLTRDEAVTTSIGWGLVAEAWANFGLGGVFMVAVLMGAALGLLQQWGGRFPVLSARGLTSLIVLLTVMRLETNMALLATSLAQALVPIAALAALAMHTRRVVA